MRHKGITLAFTRPYSSPEDLWNSLATQLDKKHTPALRSLEIGVALADRKCAETVALLSTVQAMQARHARYFPKAYASALAKLTRIDAHSGSPKRCISMCPARADPAGMQSARSIR